jgi:hypothetical protein
MKTYIATKVVQAEPEAKNGKEGYKVVYPKEPEQPEGYVSWCPKQVFERHNKAYDTAKDRVIQEVEALQEKYDKLTAFLEECEKSACPKNMHPELLKIQHIFMGGYLNVLKLRLQIWEGDK